MNNSGQVHMLEMILMSGILLTALYFVNTFEAPTHSTIGKENSLETLGEGILISLDGVPDPGSEDNDQYYSSLLARYVYEIKTKIDPPDITPLEDIEELQALNDYFEANLPEGTLYQLSLIDITRMSREGLTVDYTDELYDETSVFLIGEKISTSRIVVIDGHIYNLVLRMSFTLK